MFGTNGSQFPRVAILELFAFVFRQHKLNITCTICTVAQHPLSISLLQASCNVGVLLRRTCWLVS